MIERGELYGIDDLPYNEWVAALEERYGKRLASIMVGTPSPKRKKAYRATTGKGTRVVEVRGHAERSDASPSAVDFRHHRSRIESGK